MYLSCNSTLTYQCSISNPGWNAVTVLNICKVSTYSMHYKPPPQQPNNQQAPEETLWLFIADTPFKFQS